MTDDIKNLTFEQAFAELESLVEEMESGDLPLERSVTLFERGMALAGHCSDSLDAAFIAYLEEAEGTAEQAEADDAVVRPIPASASPSGLFSPMRLLGKSSSEVDRAVREAAELMKKHKVQVPIIGPHSLHITGNSSRQPRENLIFNLAEVIFGTPDLDTAFTNSIVKTIDLHIDAAHHTVT